MKKEKKHEKFTIHMIRLHKFLTRVHIPHLLLGLFILDPPANPVYIDHFVN